MPAGPSRRNRRRAFVMTAARTGAPLSVHTSGRNRPVASANPATMPLRVGPCGVSRDRAHHARRAYRHHVGHLWPGPNTERGRGVVSRARSVRWVWPMSAAKDTSAVPRRADPRNNRNRGPNASWSRSSRYSPRRRATSSPYRSHHCGPSLRVVEAWTSGSVARVNQSCGRQTAAVRAALTGSWVCQPPQFADRKGRKRYRD